MHPEQDYRQQLGSVNDGAKSVDYVRLLSLVLSICLGEP